MSDLRKRKTGHLSLFFNISYTNQENMSEVNPRMIKCLFGMSRLFSSVVVVYILQLYTP